MPGGDQVAEPAAAAERGQRRRADVQHQRGPYARQDQRYGQRQFDPGQHAQRRHADAARRLQQRRVVALRPAMVLDSTGSTA